MLKIKDMNSNNVIRQGDSQPREYQLDTGNLNLNLANKQATIRLMTGDYKGIAYETTATVSSENKISFSIGDVIPAREYRLEITVDDYVFPSRATDGRFDIDPSSHGQGANIIEIVGKDVLIREVKEQVINELGATGGGGGGYDDIAVQSHIANRSNPHQVTKTQVGLGNVSNTSDANKPVSTAMQSALNNKADKSQVLTNVPANAKFTDTVYTHPSSHPASMITESTARRFVTDAEKVIWNNKQGALGFTAENTSNKGQAGGYAGLDATGRVPVSQLPDFEGGDSSVEVEEARVDTSGHTNATLKERLDKEHTEVTAQLDDIGVNIRKFGVVGDGVVDDGPAIKEAHTWANANSKKLWYPPGEYYIRNAKEIVIEHDVDASQATIIVDTDIHSTSPVYRITSKKPVVNMTSGLANLTINKKTRKVPEFGGYGDAIVKVQNTNKKVYIRYGPNANEGTNQFDKFVVDDLGNLKNEVIWDFDTITQVAIYPIDEHYITVKFGKWIYNNILEADQSVYRNISVNRSRTKLSVGEEITRPIAALAHFAGIISTNLCYDVEIFDTLLEVKPARFNSNGVRTGTYGLLATDTIALTFRNVKSVEIPDDHYGWGIMGGNRLKDFRMIDCDLNRVDSHQGTHNLLVENSTIGSWGLSLTGTGLLHIKDTTIQGAANVVSLRNDYGSTWEGKIKIENVEHIPSPGSDPHVIFGNPVYVHDFGHTCHFGTEIEVDGYTVHDSGQDMISLLKVQNSTVTGKVSDYFLPKRVIVKNARTKAGNKKLRVFDIPDYTKPKASYDGSYVGEGFSNFIDTNIDVNVYSGDWIETKDMIGLEAPLISEYTSGSELLTSRLPYFNITLSELDIVFLMPKARPLKITILNSTLRHLYANDGGGSRAIISMVGGTVDSRGDVFGIRISRGNSRFVGVNILPPRKVNGTLIETQEGIRRAHEFINWGVGAENNVLLINNYFSACSLSDSYPTSIVAPNLPYFDIFRHMVPSIGAHYRVSGPSADRPVSVPSEFYEPLPVGHRYFDTTLNKPIFYTGSGWVDSTGAGVNA